MSIIDGTIDGGLAAESSEEPGRFRLAAIDIDDTLIGPDGKIGGENFVAVGTLRRHGLRVVLASGRSHANMLRFHRTLRLGHAPVVSAGGAVVRDAETGEVWFERTVPAELTAWVTQEGLARGYSVMQHRPDGIYIQARTSWTEYDQTRNDEPQILVPDLLALDPGAVAKVLWLGEPADIACEAAEATSRHAGALTVIPTDPGYLEFAAPDANKATGLAVVASRLGISPQEVIAFGDGNNDVAMLRWAGLGVAMSHARPAAIEAADVVAPAGDPERSLSRAVAAIRPVLGPPRLGARRRPAGRLVAMPGGR